MANIIWQSRVNGLNQINIVLIFCSPRAQTLVFVSKDIQHKY